MTNAKTPLALVLVLVLVLAAAGLAQAQTAADQAQAIADTLTVIESENAYAAQNCGYFSDVVNLCRTGVCRGIGIPGYPLSAPEFIEERLGRTSPAIEAKYVRTWVPYWRPATLGPDCDPNSERSYCYLASPRKVTGRPAFAGTPDGTIYIDRTGAQLLCPLPGAADTLVWPGLTHPSPGSTLPGSSVTFHWAEHDVPVNTYRLRLGSTPGGDDLFDSGLIGTTTSITAHGLPTDGSTVHAHLDYRFADRWRSAEATFLARDTPSTTDAPELVTPAPSSTLSGASVAFDWTPNNTHVLQWRLKVGSRPSGRDYYKSGRLVNVMSLVVDGLPSDGSLVFTRLFYRTTTGWRFNDYAHMATFSAGSSTPTLDLPVPGSDLPSDSVLAVWNENDTTVRRWWIYAGSERGRNDYFNSGPLRVTSTPITGLPAAGSAVYVRLWYRAARRWRHLDFAFGAADLGSDATAGGRAAKLQRPSRRPR